LVELGVVMYMCFTACCTLLHVIQHK